jgi:hypothetical protein
VPDYIFQIIYDKYEYIDSLLAAELSAKAIAGSTPAAIFIIRSFGSLPEDLLPTFSGVHQMHLAHSSILPGLKRADPESLL